METKLVRIAEISATSKHPIFTSVYHLINEDMLKQCHKELDGNKAVGIDKVTKDEYGKNLDRNIKELVQRLKNKSFKPLPSLRVYIPKGNMKPVIRASICTGEEVAGFKDIRTGKIEEIMLIRSPEELERFKEIYEITEEIAKEY